LYEIAQPDSGDILYSEGGWMDQAELDTHFKAIIASAQGFPKIINAVKPINMALGDKPKTGTVVNENQDWSKVDSLMKEEDEVVNGAGWQ
jgi:hypothetical protein